MAERVIPKMGTSESNEIWGEWPQEKATLEGFWALVER